ncbi:MAG TPA: hypothetical protein VGZ22_11985, partial [Isosphaeraceae bacterium]|nr:hypothetical protein [Isosphaeraceae bacterium]
EPDATGGVPADGAPCRYCSDRSGLANFWRSLAGNPLVYVASAINGLPGLKGDGATANLTNIGLNTAWGDWTIFTVFQRAASGAAAGHRLLDKKYDTGFLLARDGANAQWGGGIMEGTSPYGIYCTASNDAAPQILCSMRSNNATTSNHDIWLSGETNHIANTTPTGPIDTAILALGAAFAGGSPNSSTFATIAATIIYGRALTFAERATVWSYLGTKYAITLSGMGGGASHFSPETLGLNSLRGIH